MQGRNLIFIIILRNISKRHVLPRQSDSFEMIKLSCNHLRGFEHELMAQRLFPFRIIDIYWKKYQRLPSSENFSFGVWRMVITWLKNTFLVRGIARIIVIAYKMFYFAFEYHLQYGQSKSPHFVILPNLREKNAIFTHTCIYCRIMQKVYNLQLMIELGLCTK
jgi:hypothetical protein